METDKLGQVYDTEIEALDAGTTKYYIRVAQGKCVIDSLQLLLEMTKLFNGSVEVVHNTYGNAGENHPVDVWTVTCVCGEAIL